MKNWRVFYQLKEADPYRWLILFSLISVWGEKSQSVFFIEVANYPVWQTIQSLSVSTHFSSSFEVVMDLNGTKRNTL